MKRLHAVIGFACACCTAPAVAQRDTFIIPSRSSALVQVGGQCSMGRVFALVEPNVPLRELQLTAVDDRRRPLRLEVDAVVSAGVLVGRFDDGEICALRITPATAPPIIDPVAPAEGHAPA